MYGESLESYFLYLQRNLFFSNTFQLVSKSKIKCLTLDTVLEGIRFHYLLFHEMDDEFFAQLLFVKILWPPQSLILLNDTFLEKLDGEKCYWVYSTCSVEFHQKEKVWCRKLGTIRKNFVENILWNSIKKKKFGVEN